MARAMLGQTSAWHEDKKRVDNSSEGVCNGSESRSETRSGAGLEYAEDD